jgi:hypothetical protein
MPCIHHPVKHQQAVKPTGEPVQPWMLRMLAYENPEPCEAGPLIQAWCRGRFQPDMCLLQVPGRDLHRTQRRKSVHLKTASFSSEII